MKTNSSSYLRVDKDSYNNFLVGILNCKESLIISEKSLLSLKKANSYESRLQSKFLKILGNIDRAASSLQKKFGKHAPSGSENIQARTKKSRLLGEHYGNDLDKELILIQKKLKELGASLG